MFHLVHPSIGRLVGPGDFYLRLRSYSFGSGETLGGDMMVPLSTRLLFPPVSYLDSPLSNPARSAGGATHPNPQY